MGRVVKKIFGLNLKILRWLGFYPPQNYKLLYKIYANLVYCFCTVPVPTLATIHLFVQEDLTLNQICDSAFMIFQVGCFIFKMLPFIHNAEKIRKNIHMLENLHFKCKKSQEVYIESCEKNCKIITWLFLCFCLASFTTWTCTPFFRDEHNFPIDIWLPFDTTKTKTRYFLVSCMIAVGVGNGAISNGVLDPLVAGLACFASNQLKILKCNLQYLDETAENQLKKDPLKYRKEIKNKIIYEKIKECIEHQNTIFKFVQDYEDIFSSVVFTQFAASILVICLTCLQMTMVEPFTFTFFFVIIFFNTMVIEIFLYSYFGTTLYEESNSVTTAIYMGQWYEFDIKCQKALLVVMERSKKPITITAGKILDLSLSTFTTVLKRAYSLFAVLQNYRLDI